MCADRSFACRFASVSSFRRVLLTAGVCLAVMLAAASAHAQATTYTVSSKSGGGVGSTDCTTSGTLCYAITQANANAGSTINFSVTGSIFLTGALPPISESTTITGPGANLLTILGDDPLSGSGPFPVFAVSGGTTSSPVIISGLTIADGIRSISNIGALTVSDCQFIGNTDTSGKGAAIQGMGTALTVADSTFLENEQTGANGGAIYVGAGTVTLYNDTFVANQAATSGGAIYVATAASGDTIENNTFVSNSAASGAAIAFGGGSTSNEGNNLFVANSGGDVAGLTAAASDVSSASLTAAMLLPLGNYGGTTPTMLPLPGSPVIGVGVAADVPTGVTTDQRGFPITSAVDAGAVQTNYSKPNTVAGIPTSGLADVDLSSLSSPATSTAITVSSGAVNLIGPGADKLTVTGTGSASVFDVNSGAQAALYGMTITGGGGSEGAGIDNQGTLAVLGSAIVGNNGAAGTEGGGIANQGALTIIDSAIANNTALSGNVGGVEISGSGGGIENTSNGVATVIDSTISGNSAPGGTGGGLDTGGGRVTLTNVTISNNSATTGGGINDHYTTGSLMLSNSIVEGNTAVTDPDIDSAGALTNLGGNVVNTTSTATTVNLAALANNSGPNGVPTETMLPIPGAGASAICAGEKSLAVDQYGLPLTTDQRGFAMGQSGQTGGYCSSGQVDAGAVQTNYTAVAFTNAGTFGYGGTVGAAVSRPAAPIVQVTENGRSVGGVPVTLTPTGITTLTGLSATTAAAATATTQSAGADFSSLESTATGSGSLSVTLSLPGGHSLTSSTSPDIQIYDALALASATLSNATVGTSFSGTNIPAATGGSGGYSYAVTTGSLPTGMSLMTGQLSGSPVAVGTYPFTVTVTDSDGNTATQNYTLTVGQATTLITLGSNPSPSTVGESLTFTATISPSVTGSTFAKPVTFYNNGTAITNCSATGTVTVSSSGTAQATCTLTAGLPAGTYTITASYPTGDSNYSSANSTALAQTVNLGTTTTQVVSSLAAISVDAPVTFTATVTGNSTGSTPKGTVSFVIGATTICSGVTLSSAAGNTATATCPTSALEVSDSGSTVTATYAGDGKKYGSSSGTTTAPTVNPAATSVKVTSSGAVGVNQPVTLTATVTPTGPVVLSSSGTVTFSNGATPISCTSTTFTPSTGTATCTTSFGTAASQTISAIYNGDANYSATTAANVTVLPQVVNKATTAVAISSSSSTSNVDDSVTFTAAVTPYSGTTALTSPFTGAAGLAGTVTFTSNGATLCPATAVGPAGSNYRVTCATSNLAAGSASVVATYSGDGNYNGSTNNLTQTVNTIASGITLGSSSPTSTVNQSVTFTANVTPVGKALPLIGAVSFTDNGNPMSCAVGFDKTTGVATCTVANLPLGANAIVATYAGDTNYTTSSATATQTVGQSATNVTVTANPTTPMVNGSVTLTATVTETTPGAAQLSGNVSFMDNGAAIANCSAMSVNPSTGQAVCTTATLPLGANAITAQYANDTNFSGSTGTANVTVAQAKTALSLLSSASGNASAVNQIVTFTATVSGASGVSKFTGKMSFASGGTAIAGCSGLPVDPTTGVASCTTTTLTAGTRSISATYIGDPNFTNGSASVVENVTAASSTMTLTSSPNPSVVENPKNSDDVVNLTAAISPSNGGVPLAGTVAFTDNGIAINGCTAIPVNASTGLATCSSTFSTFGAHSIVAVYGNDPNYTSSQGAATQQVQDYSLAISPTTAISVTQGSTNANDPSTAQPISVSAESFGGFTGNAALTCTVAAVATTQGAVLPTCSLGATNLAIASGAVSQPVAVTINTGSGSTLASPGTYNVFVTGVDATTGLTHATAALTVDVRYNAPPITMTSGATTGNTTGLNFVLPAGVGITGFQCTSVTGPTLSVSVNPSGLGMGCSFNPSSIAPAGSVQNGSTTLTLSTNVPLSQAKLDHNGGFGGGSAIEMAGMIGVPLFMLLGFLPGVRRTRKIFFRYLGIVLVAVLLFGGVSGCGGGSFTAPTQATGTTPPGTYNVLVQGTGTDGHTYEAVVTVNVTR